MGSEWLEGPLEHLAAPERGSIAIGPFGSRMKADCYVEKGVALIRGTNLGRGKSLSGEFVFITPEKAAELGNANLKPTDLVFPHRGAIGEVGIVPDDGRRYALSTSLMKIALDSNRALAEFYYYFFKSTKGQAELLKNASQVGTPGISTPLKSLRECVVPIPPLAEQAGAVAVLRSLDDRIDLLRQTNITLEAIAQALFKSWFVDFDPVRAKAEGREPEAMDAATAALFPSEFEASELGLIPKRWHIAKLSDLVELAYGKALKASDRVAGEIPVYGSGGITGWHDVALVKKPTIIVGRKGSVGTIYWEDRPCHPIDTVFFVRSKEAPLTLCLQVLRSLGLDKMNTDAAVPGLNRENAYRLEVVVAPTAVNDAWHKLVGPIYAAISNNGRRHEALSKLRDTLLPRLISGKLRLPETASLAKHAKV